MGWECDTSEGPCACGAWHDRAPVPPKPVSVTFPVDLVARLEALEEHVEILTCELDNLHLEFKSRFDRC